MTPTAACVSASPAGRVLARRIAMPAMKLPLLVGRTAADSSATCPSRQAPHRRLRSNRRRRIRLPTLCQGHGSSSVAFREQVLSKSSSTLNREQPNLGANKRRRVQGFAKNQNAAWHAGGRGFESPQVHPIEGPARDRGAFFSFIRHTGARGRPRHRRRAAHGRAPGTCHRPLRRIERPGRLRHRDGLRRGGGRTCWDCSDDRRPCHRLCQTRRPR